MTTDIAPATFGRSHVALSANLRYPFQPNTGPARAVLPLPRNKLYPLTRAFGARRGSACKQGPGDYERPSWRFCRVIQPREPSLGERLGQFDLALHPDETRLIAFSRFAEVDRRARGLGRPETINFLGFTHCCRTTTGAGGSGSDISSLQSG